MNSCELLILLHYCDIKVHNIGTENNAIHTLHILYLTNQMEHCLNILCAKGSLSSGLLCCR